ncbi:low temperature requirement protein A [Micromonospora sediminicola]|uniref:low temperature requirement protein A n=1 Tax=Micromonospora sediminicola TaxID=946078 RepID=UPI0033E2F6F4
MGRIIRSQLISWGGPGTRATRLELFYDLVFVFAFFNVSTLTSKNLTAQSLLEALLVLVLLWWCWTGFVTIGNAVRSDEGVMPLIGLAMMVPVFLLAVSVGVAFRDEPGGLYGPWLFAVAYLMTWGLKAAALWTIARAEGTPRRPALLLVGPALVSTVVVLLAAVVPQRIVAAGAVQNVRIGFWVVALVLEYLGGLLLARTGWRLRSVGHAAERHALIVLVALGESVIALGIGASAQYGRPVGLPTVFASALGIVVIAALWWLYFDWIAAAVEQRLHGVRGPGRIPLARDVYSYLHLPLVVGIILFALSLERLLGILLHAAHPTGEERPGQLHPLLLYGGVILFALALVAIELRALRRLDRVLLGAALVLAALVPVAYQVPELAALALLAGVTLGVVTVQLRVTRALRREVRRVALDEQTRMETELNRWRARRL